MAAPAARQAQASSAISGTLRGTCGLSALGVAPLMAASITRGCMPVSRLGPSGYRAGTVWDRPPNHLCAAFLLKGLSLGDETMHAGYSGVGMGVTWTSAQLAAFAIGAAVLLGCSPDQAP